MAIEVDKNYVRRHGYATSLDECVVFAITRKGQLSDKIGSGFLDNLVDKLVSFYPSILQLPYFNSSSCLNAKSKNPAEAEKFSAGAYRAIGDLATSEQGALLLTPS